MDVSYPLDKGIVEVHYSDSDDKISFVYQRFVPVIPNVGDTITRGEVSYKIKEINHKFEPRQDGGASHHITLICERSDV